MIKWCWLFYHFYRTFLALLCLSSLSSPTSQWTKLIGGVNAQKAKMVLTINIHHTQTYHDDGSKSISNNDIIPQSIIPNVMMQFESITLPRNDTSIPISARNSYKENAASDRENYNQQGENNATYEVYDLFDVSYIKLVLHEYIQTPSSSVSSSSSSSSSSKAIDNKTDDYHDGIFHDIMKARRKSNTTLSNNDLLFRRRYLTTATTTTTTNTQTIFFYKSTASYRSMKTSIIDTDDTTITNNETVWHGSTITSTPTLHTSNDSIIGFCSLYSLGGIIRSGTFITDDTTYDLIYLMNNQSYIIRSTPWADYPTDDFSDDYHNQTYSFDSNNNNDTINEGSRLQYPSLVSVNPNENEIVTDWIDVQGPAAIIYNNPSDDLSQSKSSSSNVVVDIIVIITNRAMCEYAGYYINCPSSTTPSFPYCSVTEENYTPILNKIYQVIAETNNAMQYVNVEIRLKETNFLVDDGSQNNRTGWDPISTGEGIGLIRTNAFVQQARNEQKADLVAVIAGNGGNCGIAVVLGYISITNHKCLSGYTFSHEIGHNFGCNHNREAYGTNVPNQPFAFAYNDLVNRKYRTFVAYECGGQGGRCPRIPYFSSSVITLPDGRILGNEANDNLRAIGDYAPRLASFQQPNPLSPPVSPPTFKPFRSPSRAPSRSPSRKPSSRPSARPSRSPSRAPSHSPTSVPSYSPTSIPSYPPSSVPSYSPTISMSPTVSPRPSNQPSTSTKPSYIPSYEPTIIPSLSSLPSHEPSSLPSNIDPDTCRTTCQRRNWSGGTSTANNGVMVYSRIVFGSICIRRCIPPGFLFFYQRILRYSCSACP